MNTTDFLSKVYGDCTVVVTGGHGFKGAWLCSMLVELGANVHAVGIQRDDNLLWNHIASHSKRLHSHFIDVADPTSAQFVADLNPDIIFHLAAQPIVSVGYDDPYNTFASNLMGTVNMLEAMRKIDKTVTGIFATTDKVYKNFEKIEGYTEDEMLGGHDPYSASKAASSLAISSYNSSYFDTVNTEKAKKVIEVRAGNVIGGGDFSKNRIVVDLIQAAKANKPVEIKSFNSVRPFQHVLDAVFVYVFLGAVYSLDSTNAFPHRVYNVGPNNASIMSVRELALYFHKALDVAIIDAQKANFHETKLLSLDSSLLRNTFKWSPIWGEKDILLGKTCQWYAAWLKDEDLTAMTISQVKEFLNDVNERSI